MSAPKRKLSFRKKGMALVSLILAMSLVLTGTFAWYDFVQSAENVFKGQTNYDVKLEENFDPEKWPDKEGGEIDKQIYVTNKGEDSLFIRVQLDELLKLDDKTVQDYVTHNYKPGSELDCGKVFHDYFKWVMGTEVKTLKQWYDEGKPNGPFWLLDQDGWAYWGEKLEGKTSTRFLLDKVILEKKPSALKYEYRINAKLQAVSESDLDQWLKGATTDGKEITKATEDAAYLLKGMSSDHGNPGEGEIEGEDGKIYKSYGHNVFAPKTGTNAEGSVYGDLFAAGEDKKPGSSDDLKDAVVQGKDMAYYRGPFTDDKGNAYYYAYGPDDNLGTKDDVKRYPGTDGEIGTEDDTDTAPEVVVTVTAVKVSPAAAEIQKGKSQTFKATVEGENSPAQTVKWEIQGAESKGTIISKDGRLTIAANETAKTITLTAASIVDPTKNASATITVKPADGVITGEDGKEYVDNGDNTFTPIDPATGNPDEEGIICGGKDEKPGNADDNKDKNNAPVVVITKDDGSHQLEKDNGDRWAPGDDGKLGTTDDQELVKITEEMNKTTPPADDYDKNSKPSTTKPDGTGGDGFLNEDELKEYQDAVDASVLIKLMVEPGSAAIKITKNLSTKASIVFGTVTLKAVKTPETAVGTVSWESSDSSTAKVDQNGMVTAVKAGTATITAKSGDKSAAASITVKEVVTGDAENEDGTLKEYVDNGDNTFYPADQNGNPAGNIIGGGKDQIPGSADDNTDWDGNPVKVIGSTVPHELEKENGDIWKPGSDKKVATADDILMIKITDDMNQTTPPADEFDKNSGTNGKEDDGTGGDGFLNPDENKDYEDAKNEASTLKELKVTPESATVKVVKDLADGSKVTSGTITLKAEKVPGSAAGTITWKSSDPAAASVDSSGKVTAVKAGTATITASCEGKEAASVITIKEVVTGGGTNPDDSKTEYVDNGDNTFYPADVNGEPAGAIFGGGKDMIPGTADDNTDKDGAPVKVVDGPDKTHQLEKENGDRWSPGTDGKLATPDDILLIKITDDMNNTTPKAEEFDKNSKPAGSTEDGTGGDGYLNPDENKDYEDAKENASTLQSLTMNKSNTMLKIKKNSAGVITKGEETLEAAKTPSTATGDITWSSSDDKIVTVENGKITAAAIGEATITAASQGKTATCIVKVIAVTVDDSDKEWIDNGDNTYSPLDPDTGNGKDEEMIWGGDDKKPGTTDDKPVVKDENGNKYVEEPENIFMPVKPDGTLDKDNTIWGGNDKKPGSADDQDAVVGKDKKGYVDLGDNVFVPVDTTGNIPAAGNDLTKVADKDLICAGADKDPGTPADNNKTAADQTGTLYPVKTGKDDGKHYLGPNASDDNAYWAPGTDGLLGTADDTTVYPGPDGEIGTDDDEQANPPKVTFKNPANGPEVPKKTVQTGQKVEAPEVNWTDHYFIGWYTDAAYTTKYDFNTAVTADMTIYGRWYRDTKMNVFIELKDDGSDNNEYMICGGLNTTFDYGDGDDLWMESFPGTAARPDWAEDYYSVVIGTDGDYYLQLTRNGIKGSVRPGGYFWYKGADGMLGTNDDVAYMNEGKHLPNASVDTEALDLDGFPFVFAKYTALRDPKIAPNLRGAAAAASAFTSRPVFYTANIQTLASPKAVIVAESIGRYSGNPKAGNVFVPSRTDEDGFPKNYYDNMVWGGPDGSLNTEDDNMTAIRSTSNNKVYVDYSDNVFSPVKEDGTLDLTAEVWAGDNGVPGDGDDRSPIATDEDGGHYINNKDNTYIAITARGKLGKLWCAGPDKIIGNEDDIVGSIVTGADGNRYLGPQGDGLYWAYGPDGLLTGANGDKYGNDDIKIWNGADGEIGTPDDGKLTPGEDGKEYIESPKNIFTPIKDNGTMDNENKVWGGNDQKPGSSDDKPAVAEDGNGYVNNGDNTFIPVDEAGNIPGTGNDPAKTPDADLICGGLDQTPGTTDDNQDKNGDPVHVVTTPDGTHFIEKENGDRWAAGTDDKVGTADDTPMVKITDEMDQKLPPASDYDKNSKPSGSVSDGTNGDGYLNPQEREAWNEATGATSDLVDLYVKPDSITLQILTDSAGQTTNQTRKLESVKIPATAKGDASWSSADEKIATVSADGTVTPVSNGTTAVTATIGKKTAICTVTVLKLIKGSDNQTYIDNGDNTFTPADPSTGEPTGNPDKFGGDNKKPDADDKDVVKGEDGKKYVEEPKNIFTPIVTDQSSPELGTLDRTNEIWGGNDQKPGTADDKAATVQKGVGYVDLKDNVFIPVDSEGNIPAADNNTAEVPDNKLICGGEDQKPGTADDIADKVIRGDKLEGLEAGKHYLDNGNNSYQAYGPDKMLGTADDTTIWQGKANVSFNYNFSGATSVTYTVNRGEKVSSFTPDRAAEVGAYIFDGWYMDAAGKNLYDFSTVVTQNMVLYAKWSRDLVGTVGDTELNSTVTIDGIDWYVIRKTKTEVELLSVNLDANMAYSKANSVVWATSDLRKYFNDEWYNKRSEDFKNIIKTVDKTGVQDNVYALSTNEVNSLPVNIRKAKYMGNTLTTYYLADGFQPGWWTRTQSYNNTTLYCVGAFNGSYDRDDVAGPDMIPANCKVLTNAPMSNYARPALTIDMTK